MRKRLFSIILILTIVIGGIPGAAFALDVNTTQNNETYTDMPNNWSKTALENAVANGLLAGFNGKIMPKANLTRAQMAAIITRAFGMTKGASLSEYSDVSADAWYYDDMAKAVQMKVFVGSNNKLNPDSKISRQEAFTVLARAFKLNESDESALDRFSDKELIGEWAKDGAAALADAEYISGSKGKLNPKQNMTRAEFAQLMDNILKKYVTKAGIYSEDMIGNVMINVADVTLSNMKITGDLIIGDGVGDGDVTLDNVTVTGKTVIRGGGVNSIKITGTTNLNNIIIARVDGQVRVYSESGAEIGEIIVDGNDDVIIEGEAGTVTVTAPDITVKATNANIEAAVINGENSKIVVSENSKINLVTVNSKGADISGAGEISNVEANANDVTVSTVGTKVSSAEGTTGVKAGTITVGEGNTETVPGSSTSKHSSSSNGNSPPSTPATPTTPPEYFLYDLDTATNTITITDYVGYTSPGGHNVVIPTTISGAAVVHIGNNAFNGSGGKSSDPQPIESVVIPNSVLSIGDGAFYRNLLTTVTIPDSVTSIGDQAFYDCGNLLYVTIGSGVNGIGEYVFYDCIALEKFTVAAGNESYCSSDDGVLFNKEKTTILQFPVANERVSYDIPDSVTTIGAMAFSSCIKLTTITIPDSVTSIGDAAFSNCSNLVAISIPDGVTSIGASAFSSCTSLTSSIVIPDGVTSISDWTFDSCTSLVSVTLPDSVTSIGNSAFNGCTSLGGITLPDIVTNIGEYAFSNCASLNEITIPDHEESISIGRFAFQGCTGLSEIIIPKSVTSVGEAVFGYCTGLTSFTISTGSGITSISNRMFTGCTGLTNIAIPDSITSIEASAFSNCSGLSSVIISNSVTSIEAYTFMNCTNLEAITLPAGVISFGSDAIINPTNTLNLFTIYTDKGAGKYTRSGGDVWEKYKP